MALAPGVLAAGTGGALSALAFEPWGQGWVAPVGVALLVGPILGTIASLPSRPAARRAAALGAVHGGVAAALLLWWLWEAIAPAAWAGLVVAHAGWGAVLGLGVAVVASVPGRLLWVASVWGTVELARSSWPFGGLPWGRLGQAALDTPWQDLLGWAGVSGTSWVAALAGSALAALVCDRGPGRVGASLVLAAHALVVMTLPSATGTAVGEQVARVAVVQPGVPGDGTDLGAHHRQVTNRLVVETARLFGGSEGRGSRSPDLVLWPENATAVDPFEDPRARAAIRDTVLAAGVPLVAGSVLEGPRTGTLANTSVAWSPDGSGGVAEMGRYVKQNLVPFGEYVPLRPLAERVSPHIADVPVDMVPGDRAQAVRAGGLRLALALCFDVAHRDPLASQVRQGADIVAVQTSNATFAGTTQPDQQWAISRVRAVELGRSVVVSSTTGVSGAIGPDGTVLARLASGGRVGVVLEVPVVTTITPATRVGAWPESLLLVMTVVGGVRAAARRRISTVSRHRQA